MNKPDLSQLVAMAVAEEVGGRSHEEPKAVPIINWGGFVNSSFKVRIGARSFHTKLTAEPENIACLQRWQRFHERLSDQYSAPRMLGWIKIQDNSLEGPIFEWIEGVEPESLLDVIPILSRLHEDTKFAEMLSLDGEPSRNCINAYEDTFHDRFNEDLKEIHSHTPPFVSAETVDWMGSERDELFSLVQRTAAFSESANKPVHQDIWLNNLIYSEDRIRILDWDDLGLGDPILDWATLFGPSKNFLKPAGKEMLPLLNLTVNESKRFEIYLRAALLDWVIDSPADWIEAEGTIEEKRMRAEKESTHIQAYKIYRKLYS